MASKGGWNGGGNWHSGGWYGNNNFHFSWKGKGSLKGNCGSLPGTLSSLQDTGRNDPARSGPPLRWRALLAGSLPLFASSIETAFEGAVRDQTERTTSSWVSGALDALTSVVRCAVTHDKHSGPCQRSGPSGEASGRDDEKA